MHVHVQEGSPFQFQLIHELRSPFGGRKASTRKQHHFLEVTLYRSCDLRAPTPGAQPKLKKEPDFFACARALPGFWKSRTSARLLNSPTVQRQACFQGCGLLRQANDQTAGVAKTSTRVAWHLKSTRFYIKPHPVWRLVVEQQGLVGRSFQLTCQEG